MATPTSLQQEIGKRTPFDAPEQEVFLNLLRTACLLESQFERFFRKHGLTHATYNALRILRGHGPQGTPSQTIASQLITPVPDVTRLVDRLVEQDLAERFKIKDDRRVVQVRITRAGLDLLGRLDGPVLELHREQLAHFSREQLDELSRLLFTARHPPAEGGTDDAAPRRRVSPR